MNNETQVKVGHEPGPWRIEPEDTAPDGQIFIESKDSVVCRLDSRTIIDEANARLIAAAPELLEALKLLKAFLNDLSTSNPGYLGKLVLQDYGQFNDSMIAMERAIAKAEKGVQS